MIRNLKLAYQIYNFFHKKDLIHNVDVYAKYGVNKKYYSSISSEDFKHLNSEELVEEGRKGSLTDLQYYNKSSDQTKSNIEQFDDQGYCVIPGFADLEVVNQINTEIDELLESKQIQFKYRNKLMFAIHKSNYLRQFWQDHDILPLLDYLIKGDAELFQSINFINGSEQKTHSDSIHMTTFPLGGLLGVWLALEDINEDNGPIHYYPQSHKLPYYLNRDYDNLGNKFFLGSNGYTGYESMIQRKISEQHVEKETFHAKAGDLFIWHANLLHGGNMHTNKSKTRKSMVLHYFDARRICYHEITQRPALMKSDQR